jgi:peroxiredoxin
MQFFSGVGLRAALLVLPISVPFALRAEENPSPSPPSKVLPELSDFSLADCAGKPCTLKDLNSHKIAVLFFMGTECPVSNFYAPVLERLAKAYAGKGVGVYGVHPDPDLTAAEAARHAADYRLTFRVLLDPKQSLARQAGVETVPQVVVVARSGKMMYRGRIDDRFSLDGKRRDEPRVKDLELALDAVLDGKDPPTKQTKAYGCPLPEPVPPKKK